MYIVVAVCIVVILVAQKIFNVLTAGRYHSDVPLSGKTFIITGANAGLGRSSAITIARRGGRVIVACRNEGRGLAAVKDIITATGNNNVVYKRLDLASFASIKAFCEDIYATEPRLDVLVNNAGISDYTEPIETEDGIGLVMQTNYFGHALLTMYLLDLLKSSAPSRIVNVSSILHSLGMVSSKNITKDTDRFRGRPYLKSKLCQVLFTIELGRRLKDTGVTVNALNPGACLTNIAESQPGVISAITRVVLWAYGKSCDVGAETIIHLATAEEVSSISGAYFSDCKQTSLCRWFDADKDSARVWNATETVLKEPLQKWSNCSDRKSSAVICNGHHEYKGLVEAEEDERATQYNMRLRM